jgi:PAS domain S-box-containing protein
MQDLELLKSIFNGIEEIIYVCDPETHELLFVNSAFKRITGEIPTGSKCHKVLQNRETPCPFCTNTIIFHDKPGHAHVWEFQNQVTGRWYRCSDKAIPWAGGRMVRFELATDITDYKDQQARSGNALEQSESLVRSITDNLVNGMVYQIIRHADGAREMTYLSERVRDFYGVTPEQGMADASRIYGRVHPDDGRRLFELEERAHETMSVFQSEARVMRPDGTWRWSLFVSRPTALGGGLTRWDGIEFDITDRKTAEIELETYKLHLEQLVEERTAELQSTTEQLLHAQKMEAIGQLAGGIAHDFNNILSIISGTAELLLKSTPADAPIAAKLERILNSGMRAKDLTMKLLTFARKEKLNVKTVCPETIVADIVDTLTSTTTEKIRISHDCAPGAPCIRADANQLFQALLNICLNAIDAMPGGGSLRMQIRTESIEHDEAKENGVQSGDFVVIEISDTGTGIEPDKIANIFEPFYTTKSQGKGSGLGLSVAHGIIASHGGFIKVESSANQGATFRLFLPATDPEPDEAPHGAPAQAQTSQGRILIIDDDEAFVEMLKEALELDGFEVETAVSGPQAIECYRHAMRRTDAIILDMIMTEMGGVEVFAELKKLNSGAKIALCSGYNKDGDATALLESGAMAYIQKPFVISEVTETLTRMINGKPAQAQ